ncbi:MAG: AMP-binding protein, partial [Planctomycetota bacterium]
MKFSPRNLLQSPATSEDLATFELPLEQAASLASAINEQLPAASAEQRWQQIVTNVLSPSLPFGLHLWLFESVYLDTGERLQNPVAWMPTESATKDSSVAKLMRQVGAKDVASLHQWTTEQRAQYWNLVVRELGIRFSDEEAPLIEDSEDPNAWLPAKRFNIVESCFQGDPDRPAIISRDEAGNERHASVAELESLTNRVANGLQEAGFRSGDRIGMMLTMSIEAVAAYLGTINAGCVPVSIAESFAAPEISLRMKVANAKGIFTNDVIQRGGKQLASYKKWKETGGEAVAFVIPAGEELSVQINGSDLAWSDFLSHDAASASRMMTAKDELNILFSSGTTAEPKAIPWTHSTPLKCAADGRFHQNIHEESIVAWPTSLGWMMGPWLIFASLLNRATMALFEGAPNSESFCRFVQDSRVTMLGVIPSLVRAWRSSNAIDGLDWSSIEAFSSTGECSDAEDMLYLMSRAGYRPVIEYCGGTEIGGGYIASTVVQANRPSCFSTPALGTEFILLNDGSPADEGEVFLNGPSIGLSQALLNADHEAVYFSGTPSPSGYKRLRRHGDALARLPDGSYRAVGRADDAMNLGGIKVSAVEIERCLNQLPGVLETAAVSTQGAHPSALVVFAVVDKAMDVDELKATMQTRLSKQ